MNCLLTADVHKAVLLRTGLVSLDPVGLSPVYRETHLHIRGLHILYDVSLLQYLPQVLPFTHRRKKAPLGAWWEKRYAPNTPW